MLSDLNLIFAEDCQFCLQIDFVLAGQGNRPSKHTSACPKLNHSYAWLSDQGLQFQGAEAGLGFCLTYELGTDCCLITPASSFFEFENLLSLRRLSLKVDLNTLVSGKDFSFSEMGACVD